jgi:uncharacterized protein YbdZ (MbtH family)
MIWDDENTIFQVVVNHEEQYSIWPVDREIPNGWRDVGKSGKKEECLAYINEVWTDMRPLSLRKKMEEAERERAKQKKPAAKKKVAPKKTISGDELVDRLSKGDHPVIASLRPERTVSLFKEAIDRGYVHIKFTDTKGGTELGVRLDQEACDFDTADFDAGAGAVHIEGGLTLNYVPVRCIADIDLGSLEGTGHLVPVKE